MSSPVGFLDFFVLEASDYIEQLDGLVARAGAVGPDAESVQRLARALRGSATMAKLPSFAELAAAVERVGRALRDGALSWEPGLHSALVSAIDDLKTLTRAVRSWSPAEDKRASARAAELSRLAPESAARGATPVGATGASFFGGETANIAAGLELLATRPADREGAANVLRRVRALRGVAGIKEVPALAEVMEGAELAAKPLELREGPLSREALEVLRTAAALLRRIATGLREGGGSNSTARSDALVHEREQFDRALESLVESESARERILPIAELFYRDGEPDVVRSASNPPTSPAERFRLEMVSQAEHLRGLVMDVRRAPDESARDRLRTALRRALRSLSAAASSFGERDVATQLAAREPLVTALDTASLQLLESVSKVLSEPGSGGADLAKRLAEAGRTRNVETPTEPIPVTPRAPTPAKAFTPARAATPVSPAPAIPAARMPTPAAQMRAVAPAPKPNNRPDVSGEHLATVLDDSLASLDTLSTRPLTPSSPLPDQSPVPINRLVYRGRAALERAIELREQLRRSGAQPSISDLEELFDLLDLALVS